MIKLIGVLIVIIGFALKKDTIATVVVAGIVTGLVAGLNPMQILNTLGKAFVTNRTATLFVLTLPVIGLCERYGMKDKSVDLIRRLKNATPGKILSAYLFVRSLAAAFSIRLGGHPQFVRPLVQPMAEGAAVAKHGKIDEHTQDAIKGLAAAMENYGNFFSQNVFMGSSGTLLIVATLTELKYNVNALDVAKDSIPVAVLAVIIGVIQNWINDRRLVKKYGASNAGHLEGKNA